MAHFCWDRARAGGVHSTRASAQVTAAGSVTSRIEAMSTRPNRQNRSTRSRMVGALSTKAKVESVPCSPLSSSTRILEANREKWVNHFTPRTIIILMKTINDLYQTRLARAPAPSLLAPPPAGLFLQSEPRRWGSVGARGLTTGESGEIFVPSPAQT